MDEISRRTLELLVEKAEKLRRYTSEDNHFGGLLGIYSNIEGSDWKLYPE